VSALSADLGLSLALKEVVMKDHTKSAEIHLRLSLRTYERLKAIAERKEHSVALLCRDILREWLDAQEENVSRHQV
jgi:predicted DNA-binding protein